MLDLLLMKVGKSSEYLFCIHLYSIFFKEAIFWKNICKARIHLLKINTEKLVQELTAKELNYIFMFELFVFLNFIL